MHIALLLLLCLIGLAATAIALRFALAGETTQEERWRMGYISAATMWLFLTLSWVRDLLLEL